MNDGFILLSRTLLDSDVFASQKLLKIWIWCLLKANFKDKHVPLKIGKGETIVNVKRGSFLFGRFKAEEELFIDGSTVYKSIQKLKEMGMITINSNNQYSVITVCKYDEYQQTDNYKVTTKEQPKDNQVTTKGQPSNTTKNYNNDNNDNNNIDFDLFLKWFNSTTGKNLRVVTKKAKANIKARLKEGFLKEDLQAAVLNCFNDDYHKSNNHKYLTPEFISRSDKMEKFCSVKPDKKETHNISITHSNYVNQ